MVIGRGRGRGRSRAVSERDLEPDLALWAAGRAMELEGSDALLAVVVVVVRGGDEEVLEGAAEGGDEGLGGLRGLGVEDLEGKDGVGGIVDVVEWEWDWDGEPLVPDGTGGAAVVRLGGELVVRIEPEDGIGLELAVAPVDVLQVLGRNDRQIQIMIQHLMLMLIQKRMTSCYCGGGRGGCCRRR